MASETADDDFTTLRVRSATRDKLRAEKVGNETYDDVIERLIEDQ